MKRRYRRRDAKPGQVIVYYGKIEHEGPDLVTAWGGEGATKRHANLVTQIFSNKNLRNAFDAEDRKRSGGLPTFYDLSWSEELERSGFDLTTLKFSIEMKRQTVGASTGAKSENQPGKS